MLVCIPLLKHIIPSRLISLVGTPHTCHYENTRDALLARKHVLCAKPFTSNAAELRDLIKLAKGRKLFLMEAMWTCFQISFFIPFDNH